MFGRTVLRLTDLDLLMAVAVPEISETDPSQARPVHRIIVDLLDDRTLAIPVSDDGVTLIEFKQLRINRVLFRPRNLPPCVSVRVRFFQHRLTDAHIWVSQDAVDDLIRYVALDQSD